MVVWKDRGWNCRRELDRRERGVNKSRFVAFLRNYIDANTCHDRLSTARQHDMGTQQRAPNGIVFFGYRQSPYACRVQHYLAFRNISYAICVGSASPMTHLPSHYVLTAVQDPTSKVTTARSQCAGHQLPPHTFARHRSRCLSGLPVYHTPARGTVPSVGRTPCALVSADEGSVAAHHSYSRRSAQWCVLACDRIHRWSVSVDE